MDQRQHPKEPQTAENRDSQSGQQPSRWEKFAQRWPDNPALEQDTLYALPKALISAIQEEIPGFFSEEEEEFERDLTSTSGSGFFFQQAFSYLGLGEAEAEVEDDIARKARESSERIGEMLKEDLRDKGLNEAQIDGHYEQEKKIQRRVLEMQQAFAGWLVGPVISFVSVWQGMLFAC